MDNNMQNDLFGMIDMIPDNPLKNRRVGFLGKFKNRAALIRKVKESYGASEKSNDNITKDTQILVLGADVKQEDLNRHLCYEHDGFHPLVINEAQLQDIFNGHYSEYITPEEVKKQISIDISYYNWIPPIVKNNEEQVVRRSSPIIYGEQNPVYGMEMYVPNIPGINMNAFRQLIGNLGGYANKDFYDEVSVVLLSDETLAKLRQGIKDDTILYIENKYNNSSTDLFNIQFTTESEFISWVEARVNKYEDESTRKLLNAYLESKQNSSEPGNGSFAHFIN